MFDFALQKICVTDMSVKILQDTADRYNTLEKEGKEYIDGLVREYENLTLDNLKGTEYIGVRVSSPPGSSPSTCNDIILKKANEGDYTTGKTVLIVDGKIDLIEHARFKVKAGEQGQPTAYVPKRIEKTESNSSFTKLLADDGNFLEIHESQLEKFYTITDRDQANQLVKDHIRVSVGQIQQHGTLLSFMIVKSGSIGGELKFKESCVQMVCRPDGGVNFIKVVKIDMSGKVLNYPTCTIEINGRTVIRHSEDVGEMNFNQKIIYEGPIDGNGTLKGKGKMRIQIGTHNERLVEGEWFGDGNSVRNATVKYLKQGITYIGDLKGMKRHGKGRLINHEAGSIFDYTFVDGEISGPFSAILNDGKAEGNVNGKSMTGKRYIKAETFMSPEEMASYGNPEWGLIHEGDLDPLTIVLNGHGKLTYPNGDYIIGQFKNGENDGYSTLYSKSAGTLSGNMKGSTFIGNVKWEMSDGSLYQGELQNGIPNGQGTMTSPDGLVNHGTWVDGQLVQTLDQIMYMADEKNRASKSTAADKPDLRLKGGSGEVQGGGARTFKPPASNNIAKMQGFDLYKSSIYSGRHAMSIAAAMPRSCLPMLSTRRPTFAGLMIGMIRMCRK
jgi:hypothetical protein